MDENPSRAWLWYFIGLLALIGVALIMLGSGTANAQPKCMDLSTLVDELGEKYGEVIVWAGNMRTPPGAPEVKVMKFQSPKGTWTLVAVQGIQACFMSVGDGATPSIGKGV